MATVRGFNKRLIPDSVGLLFILYFPFFSVVSSKTFSFSLNFRISPLPAMRKFLDEDDGAGNMENRKKSAECQAYRATLRL